MRHIYKCSIGNENRAHVNYGMRKDYIFGKNAVHFLPSSSSTVMSNFSENIILVRSVITCICGRVRSG